MANLDQALHGLRSEYVAEADQNLGQIARFLEEAERDPMGPALEQLHRRFLGLAGSGYTYGFPEVSTLGRQGEKLCAALLRDRAIWSPSVLQACGSVLLRLRAEFDRLQAAYDLAYAPPVAAPRPASFRPWA
jgi:hypothetical protein